MTSKKNSEIILDYDAAGQPVAEINPQPTLPSKEEASGATYNGLGPDFFLNDGLGGAQGQHKPSPADDLSKAKDLPAPKSQAADYVRDSDYLPKGKN